MPRAKENGRACEDGRPGARLSDDVRYTDGAERLLAQGTMLFHMGEVEVRRFGPGEWPRRVLSRNDLLATRRRRLRFPCWPGAVVRGR
jgi:hypothetical protein